MPTDSEKKKIMNYKQQLNNFITEYETNNIKRISALKKDFDIYMTEQESLNKYNQKTSEIQFAKNKKRTLNNVGINIMKADKSKILILEIKLYKEALENLKNITMMNVAKLKILTNEMNKEVKKARPGLTFFKKGTTVRPPKFNGLHWTR